jgi:hypothetical protein
MIVVVEIFSVMRVMLIPCCEENVKRFLHSSFTRPRYGLATEEPFVMRTAVRRLVILAALLGANPTFAGGTITPAGDLKIPKKEVTAKVKFYGYKVGNVLVEVLALRAPDGTIRTALNTCQVCYASGRGWYTQQGEVLVCNNCGNRFAARQVELIKGGCNPVPITKDLKREDTEFVYIPKTIFEQARPLFLKWKK